MLSFFRNDPLTEPALALYRAIVAQSRHTHFYADLGIADTPRGRFMAISLHVALVLRRLKQAPEAVAFAQKLFDCFFQDMDRSLREMGVSDLAIGKRVGDLAKSFYGLLGSLTAALDSGDRAALVEALSRNVYDDAPNKTAELAAYCESMAAFLIRQPAGELIAGRIEFAEPAAA
jgi:cytochrome b pre-mRNA-processing protein 3